LNSFVSLYRPVTVFRARECTFNLQKNEGDFLTLGGNNWYARNLLQREKRSHFENTVLLQYIVPV